MDISNNSVVSLTWTLNDAQGEELDVLDEPVDFLIGGNDLLARVEEALQGHSAGATLNLHLEPEEAFGDFDEQLLFLEPLALFPEGIEECMRFEGTALPAGVNPDAVREGFYTVSELYPEHVVLDGNHPLAGIALRLHLKVHAVRAATGAEISAGSAGTGFFRIDAPAPDSGALH